jgi:hypothetical protein
MEKEINISIPEGYEIDKDKSTFTKIVFKKIENKLPMSFDHIIIPEYYIISNGVVIKSSYENIRGNATTGNIYPTKEYAEAFLALAKLIWLRDAWNEGWMPDYNNEKQGKYAIVCYNKVLSTDTCYGTNTVMCFKTNIIRDNFFVQFKNLLEIAKPLL